MVKTHKINLNPTPFDDDERDLMDAFEQGLSKNVFVSELTSERAEVLKSAAKNTINPTKRKVSTRLAEPDLRQLKIKALEKGIPYQTLLSSIVHQYVQGTLVEKT